MAKKAPAWKQQERAAVAQEAARIMREAGIRDYRLAKTKAAERLGVVNRQSLPSNSEIEAAVSEQQRLFGGDAYAGRLQDLRSAAVHVMQLLETFEPRLVGSVLTGAVTDHSEINLHVFADAPEAVVLELMHKGIRYREGERRVRFNGNRYENVPTLTFEVGEDIVVEAAIFGPSGLRQPPTCPVEGRPMKRARIAEVEAL